MNAEIFMLSALAKKNGNAPPAANFAPTSMVQVSGQHLRGCVSIEELMRRLTKKLTSNNYSTVHSLHISKNINSDLSAADCCSSCCVWSLSLMAAWPGLEVWAVLVLVHQKYRLHRNVSEKESTESTAKLDGNLFRWFILKKFRWFIHVYPKLSDCLWKNWWSLFVHPQFFNEQLKPLPGNRWLPRRFLCSSCLRRWDLQRSVKCRCCGCDCFFWWSLCPFLFVKLSFDV